MIDGRTKTTAILSYCSPIGYGIAWIFHSQDRSVYGAFHLRQGTGLAAATISLPAVTSILERMAFFGITTVFALYGAIATLTVIGIINASSDKFSEVPIVGQYFNKWFAFIK